MSQAAIDTFSVTRKITDPRADGGSRLVHVSARQIVIERVLQNVKMKIGVPVAAYSGLVLSVRLQSETATLRLRHEDEDLDVVLDAGPAMDVAVKAKAWGALFQKPIALEEACVLVARPFSRDRMRAKPSRRSGFGRRRKIGVTGRLQTSFAGEREIIARS